MTTPPKVFISYSHDCAAHKEWVRKLGEDLQKGGIEVTLDQWDLHPGDDLPFFVESGIANSDRFILVCSEKYASKANARSGGVGYEGTVITGALAGTIHSAKFIPVVRGNLSPPELPSFIASRVYVDLEETHKYAERLDELLRTIHKSPLHKKPPLGPNPYATTTTSPIRTPASTARLMVPWDDPWFQDTQREDVVA